MRRNNAVIVALIMAGLLIISALFVRNGLVAIASQVRDKEMPQWPQQIHLVAGDSKLNVNIAKMSMQSPTGDADLTISIDNIRIAPTTTQLSPPLTQPGH